MLMGLKDFFTSLVTKTKSVTRDSLYSGLYSSGDGTPLADNLDNYVYMLENDPEVNTAVTVRVNAILASGFTIEGKSDSSLRKAMNILKQYGFSKRFLRKVLYQLVLYDHVFIEVDPSDKSMTLIDPSTMRIVHDKYGNIQKYIQVAQNGEHVEFSPENIIFIKTTEVTSSLWGIPRMKSLIKTATLKGYIEQYLLSKATNFSWKEFFRFSGMSDDEIKSSLAYLRHISQYPDQPFVLKGKREDFEVGKISDPKELEYFLGLLNYLRQQIFMLLRVPPIVVGLPDNSNRSNSDAQIKSFNIDNKALRDIVEEAFNHELFPAIGISYVQFSWNPIDKRSEKDDIEIAERLINMGANKDVVEQFLRNTGLELPKDKLFVEDVQPKKSEDMFPSRKRKDPTEMSNQFGTGEESTTREDQLVTKSIDTKYWYYDAYIENDK